MLINNSITLDAEKGTNTRPFGNQRGGWERMLGEHRIETSKSSKFLSCEPEHSDKSCKLKKKKVGNEDASCRPEWRRRLYKREDSLRDATFISWAILFFRLQEYRNSDATQHPLTTKKPIQKHLRSDSRWHKDIRLFRETGFQLWSQVFPCLWLFTVSWILSRRPQVKNHPTSFPSRSLQ